MPVTPKFSRIYEQFGEGVVTELVDWFNDVDATYRADLKDINAHNFALFDAKLEQRVSWLDAKLEQRTSELRAEFRIELANTKASIIRWMFGFWIGSWLTIVGSLVALGKLGALAPR